jgi:hypothetical protein
VVVVADVVEDVSVVVEVVCSSPWQTISQESEAMSKLPLPKNHTVPNLITHACSASGSFTVAAGVFSK